MLLRCKVENKGMFTVEWKRRYYASGIIAMAFTVEHSMDTSGEMKTK